MYGLVNRGIQDLVTELKGESGWEKVCDAAGLSGQEFAALASYPDELTYRLVDAAALVLGLPVEETLRQFGRYWILYTARIGYGPLMTMFGANMRRCLVNLNSMHNRMGSMMPGITPPRFKLIEVSPSVCRLLYFSDRPGLVPMVAGLIEGLGEKYGERIVVAVEPKSEQNATASLVITWE